MLRLHAPGHGQPSTAGPAVCVADAYISHHAQAGEPCAGKRADSPRCPGATGDRYFLYPVVDGDGPHLGCNLGGLITGKPREANSARPSSNTAGQ